MRDIILDFETLDTKDTAIVPSIGATVCNLETGEYGERFHVKLDVQEQIDAGFTFSADTLAFWMKQQEAGRNYLIEILDKKTVTVSRKQGFDMLYRFIRNVPNAFVWGNGATFDLGICIREYGQGNLPWQFWAEQDVRSIVSFCKRVFGVEFKKDTKFEGVQHNPVDDANHEAAYLMRYFEHGRNVAQSHALLSSELTDAQFRIAELEAQIAALSTAPMVVSLGDTDALTQEERESILKSIRSSPGKIVPATLHSIEDGKMRIDITGSKAEVLQALSDISGAEPAAKEDGYQVAPLSQNVQVKPGIILAIASPSVWADRERIRQECAIEIRDDIVMHDGECITQVVLKFEGETLSERDFALMQKHRLPRVMYKPNDPNRFNDLRAKVERAIWGGSFQSGGVTDEPMIREDEIPAALSEGAKEDGYLTASFYFNHAIDVELLEQFITSSDHLLGISSTPEEADVVFTDIKCLSAARLRLSQNITNAVLITVDDDEPETTATHLPQGCTESSLWNEWRDFFKAAEAVAPVEADTDMKDEVGEALPPLEPLHVLLLDSNQVVVDTLRKRHGIIAHSSLNDANSQGVEVVAVLKRFEFALTEEQGNLADKLGLDVISIKKGDYKPRDPIGQTRLYKLVEKARK